MERPELALLLAYAKRLREARRCWSPRLLDDPWLERDLRGYFPPPVVERFGAAAGRASAAARADRARSTPTSSSTRSGRRSSPSSWPSAAPAGGGRARLPDRARGDRRGGATGRRSRSLEGKVEPEVAGRADGRRRRARRRDHALVPRRGRAGRPGVDDRGRARGLPAARRGGARDSAARSCRSARRAGRRALSPRRACRSSWRAPTRCGPGSSTRRRSRRWPAPPAARSRTSRAVFVAVGERLPLNELEEALGALPAPRADGALGAPGRARGRPPRAPGHRGARARRRRRAATRRRRSTRFLAAHGEECRRLEAFMRTLSREGETDLAGLALAVRQLRELAE